MRVCAGWSEPLLVAHTTLLEISCHGSYFISTNYSNGVGSHALTTLSYNPPIKTAFINKHMGFGTPCLKHNQFLVGVRVYDQVLIKRLALLQWLVGILTIRHMESIVSIQAANNFGTDQSDQICIFIDICRPPDNCVLFKIIFLITQPKDMLWVLKRTVSIKGFFWTPKTYLISN